MNDQTWGTLLRFYRRQARDPQRGGPLTQERLAELLSERYGIVYTRATISDWERGKSHIHKDNRQVLVSLLGLLCDCQGIHTVAQANDWLMVGNYRPLNEAESLSAEALTGTHTPPITIEAKGMRLAMDLIGLATLLIGLFICATDVIAMWQGSFKPTSNQSGWAYFT